MFYAFMFTKMFLLIDFWDRHFVRCNCIHDGSFCWKLCTFLFIFWF